MPSLGRRVVNQVTELGRVRLFGGGHVARGISYFVQCVAHVTQQDAVTGLDGVRAVAVADHVQVQVIVAGHLQVVLLSPNRIVGQLVDNVNVLTLDEVGYELVFLRTLGGVTVVVTRCQSCRKQDLTQDDEWIMSHKSCPI